MNDAVFQVLIDLPTRVRGLTCPNADGSYTVFLNARLSADQQREAYRHELSHIQGDDFERADVQQIELHAHGIQT